MIRNLLALASIAAASANPISVPYSNDFDNTDGSHFFAPSGNGYNWGWDWPSGTYINWVSARNRTSTATSEIRQLGGPASTATDFYLRVTVDPVSIVGGGQSMGLAACGSTSTLGSTYLADVKPGTNRFRLLRLSGGTSALAPERSFSTLTLSDLNPFELEFKGTYSGNSVTLELTVHKDGASETISGTDFNPLTGTHFGLRSYNAGTSMEIAYDNFEVRPLHSIQFNSQASLFAPLSESYSYTPDTLAAPVAATTLSAPVLPSWASFDGNTLSGTPASTGQFPVTLSASSSSADTEQNFTITVPAPTDLVISEFMTDNDDTLTDEDGDSSDWIELFNPTSSPIDLTGWFLTDDPTNLAKWPFPSDSILPALSFVTYFASGKDLPNHTNFSLNSRSGSYLALVRPDLSIAHGFTYPAQREDISYGLHGDYSSEGFLLNPTPRNANDLTGYSGFTGDTTFSVKRGFHESAFSTVIDCDTPNATISYTTDGSPPSESHGTQISPGSSIPISSTTILRATAFAPGLAPANVDTQSYLFLSDIRTQSSTAPSGWPASSVNGQVFNYGMDPQIINSISESAFEEAMTDIDTISLVTDLDNFVDPENGIWVNAENRGPEWERPFSIELIKPDGSEGFQVDAGVRIRGGWSRRDPNPKHSFHLYFREKYGDGKLRYPLFGLEGADEFDRLDLRTTQGRSWHFSNSADATFNRDGFARDLQFSTGQPSSRSRYYHLYINGIYFGLFQSQERTDKFYGESYLGGDKDDWDVIKTRTRPHRVEALDGTPDAWEALFNAATAGFSSDAAYYAIQGLDPSGNPDPSGSDLVEIDNLIDYLLVIFYTGQTDGPVNLSANVPKNFFAMRPRDGSAGFRFFIHDNEDSLNSVTSNATGSNPTGDRLTHFNPKWLHQQLSTNALYRRAFGDRIQKHFFNSGALTPASTRDTFRLTSDTLTNAIIGESARWGDFKVTSPYTQATWRNAINGKINSWLPARSNIVLNQLQNINLFPDLNAPTFSQHGGLLTPGSSVTLAASDTIYYTTDGSDPTKPGSPSLTSGSTLTLPSSLTLKARAFDGSEWSALTEAEFFTTTPADASNLAITEIHYNPAGPDESTEFLELKNTSTQAVHLDGLQFIDGISFTFPSGTVLQPGAYLLLVNDRAAFEAVHGNTLPVIGEFSGKLSNDGEQLLLADAAFNPVIDLTYNDALPWSSLADGSGHSLTLISGDPSQAANWRASVNPTGSPGESDSATPSGDLFFDAFGLDPNLQVTNEGGETIFTFEQKIAADSVRITPQFTASLQPWSEIGDSPFQLTSEILLPGGRIRKNYSAPTSVPLRGFFRLQLESRN